MSKTRHITPTLNKQRKTVPYAREKIYRLAEYMETSTV